MVSRIRTATSPTMSPFAAVAPPLPLELAPGASITATVTFAPSHCGPARRSFELETSEPSAFQAPLDGEGIGFEPVVDRFQQLAVGKADLLFVVDGSMSMSAAQDALALQIPELVADAERNGGDHHYAVVSTELEGKRAGHLLGRPVVLTSQEPMRAALLAERVRVSSDPVLAEGGLDAALRALTPPLSDLVNRGFLRDDAWLVIIFVADEDDRSSEAPELYGYELARLKEGTRNPELVLGAITGPSPSGCAGPAGTAEAGSRYLAVTVGAGGPFAELCSGDYQPVLGVADDVSFGLIRELHLSRPAAAASLEVRVAGELVPQRDAGGLLLWSYDPAAQAVRFAELATPEPGAEIIISYLAPC